MAIIPGETGKNIVIDTPQKQKSRNLFILFVAVIIFTVVIIYFGFGNGSSSVPSETGALPTTLPGIVGAPGQISAGAVEQVDQSNKLFESLNKATLDNPIFKDKKFHNEIIISIAHTENYAVASAIITQKP